MKIGKAWLMRSLPGNSSEAAFATMTPKTAAERVAEAIVELRRNPHNRAIQRKIYSVGDHELTPVQVDILETIVLSPGCRMNELAQALGVDASTVSRTIMPLLRLGLIDRQTRTTDRRHSSLTPTDDGLRQAATIASARRTMMEAVHSHFPDDQLQLFADLLATYIGALTAVGMALQKGGDDQG